MDFLKSLMLYMTLTFATSVQSAPAPEVTPTPTVAPPAVVETVKPAPDAIPTDGAQITVTATVKPQATEVPTPAITPNKSYRNLKQGDRGDRVKKLQTRLIELGYLSGKADGVFGGQTYRAVLSFQKRNGLDRDGVAGDMTQTYLFEYADVIPAEATPTPEAPPAETPAPQPDATIALPAAATPESLDEASVVVNGQPLSLLHQEDGVTVAAKPRLWQHEGVLFLSLDDLAASMNGWTLITAKNGALSLSAAGYAVTLTPDNNTYACTVDGTAIALAANDALLIDGEAAVSPAFLEKVLNAQTEWDEEENTLLITLQDKFLALATD